MEVVGCPCHIHSLDGTSHTTPSNVTATFVPPESDAPKVNAVPCRVPCPRGWVFDLLLVFSAFRKAKTKGQ